MAEKHKNADCRNYAPVDVAKGICHITKQLVPADGESCERFNKLPKCKFCQQYIAGTEQYLGVCAAEESQLMTYPDLIAITCEWFAWMKKSS